MTIILLLPLSQAAVPPLLDYPIHLSRVYIYNHYETNAFLGSMFNINWRPLPNLGSDILLLLLTKFVSIELAGRLLLGIIITLTLLGVLVLHRVIFSDWSWWPFLAVFPAYHGALTAGFLNYSLGLSLLLVFLATYIALRRCHSVPALVASILFGIILYFCHIVSFGIFAIFLFSYELLSNPTTARESSLFRKFARALFRTLPAFLLPICLYIRYSLLEVVSGPSPMIIGEWSLSHKLRGIFMPIMSGDYFLDLIVLMFLFATFAYFLIAKNIRYERGLILGCLLTFLFFIILPSHLLEAAFIMDRLPIAIVLVVIAATNLKRLDRRQEVTLAGLLLLLVVFRGWSLGASWRESDIYYQRMARALEQIEPAASVMIASPFTRVQGKSLGFWHNVRMKAPNWHFALLNIPALHSTSILPLTKLSAFSQMHFVWPDKQVLSLSEEFAHLDYGDGGASTWHPNEIFLTSGGDRQCQDISINLAPLEASQPDGHEEEFSDRLKLSDYAQGFDYIVLQFLDDVPDTMIEGIKQRYDYVGDDEFMVIDTRESATSQ